MSEHKAFLTWDRGDGSFDYKSYTRDHRWRFESNQELKASAAPDYLGSQDAVDPEEAYVASLAACHMLTFLAVASMKGFVVDRYEDSPVGTLAKGESGKLVITEVVLRPRIIFSGDKQPGREDLEQLHDKAHRECFLANSVMTKIRTEIEG